MTLTAQITEYSEKIQDYDRQANKMFKRNVRGDEAGEPAHDEEDIAHPEDSDDGHDDDEEQIEYDARALEAQLEDLMCDVHELGA